MKAFTYQPTSSDVETMLTTLTVMVETVFELEIDGFDDIMKQQNYFYGNSAIEHLENRETKMHFNELHAIMNSLTIADMINRKELFVDDYVQKICAKYMFSINKLLPVFEDFFDE